MKKNIDFLNYIYQNARMGIIGIENVVNNINDEALLKVIKEQLNDYENITKRAIDLFRLYKKEEKDINALAKINTYISSKINLIGKDNNKEIAKLMIKGSNTGIIEITEKLHEYEFCDERIKSLANKLLEIEEKNLEQLKPYL